MKTIITSRKVKLLALLLLFLVMVGGIWRAYSLTNEAPTSTGTNTQQDILRQNDTKVETSPRVESGSELDECLKTVDSGEKSYEATDALLQQSIQDCYDKYR